MFSEEDFATIVHAVTLQLDGFAIGKIENRLGIVTHEDGRTIYFSADFFKARIWVSGDYGVDADGRSINLGDYGINPHPKPLKISVSAEKGADKIVQDIQRRFLPSYTELYRVCRVRVEQDIAKRQASVSGLEEIAAILNIATDKIGGDYPKRLLLQTDSKYWGHVSTIGGGDSYRFEIGNISLEQAKRIAEVLKDC